MYQPLSASTVGFFKPTGSLSDHMARIAMEDPQRGSPDAAQRLRGAGWTHRPPNHLSIPEQPLDSKPSRSGLRPLALEEVVVAGPLRWSHSPPAALPQLRVVGGHGGVEPAAQAPRQVIVHHQAVPWPRRADDHLDDL